MIWLDKDGFPVEFFMGHHRIINFIRWLLHASIISTIRNRMGWARSGGGWVRARECFLSGVRAREYMYVDLASGPDVSVTQEFVKEAGHGWKARAGGDPGVDQALGAHEGESSLP